MTGEYKLYCGEQVLGSAVLAPAENVELMGKLSPSEDYERYRPLFAELTIISSDLNARERGAEEHRSLQAAVKALRLRVCGDNLEFCEGIVVTDISKWADTNAPIILTIARVGYGSES